MIAATVRTDRRGPECRMSAHTRSASVGTGTSGSNKSGTKVLEDSVTIHRRRKRRGKEHTLQTHTPIDFN